MRCSMKCDRKNKCGEYMKHHNSKSLIQYTKNVVITV